MLRVFIGYDPNETVALHVLSHSIWRHAKTPVGITPLVLTQLPMTRERNPLQTTEFSFSRFLVPWLCAYRGKAVFMDCDMLCRADVGELADYPLAGTHLSVVQHDYTPKAKTKFLDQPQTAYGKKNWSSVMVFDCERCSQLTPDYVNEASGMDLHQFKWLDSRGSQIGSLPAGWNHLVGEYPENPEAKLVHFTLGGPWFWKYRECEYAAQWRAEKNLMLHHNPMGEYALAESSGT